jgi:hypothetical protein
MFFNFANKRKKNDTASGKIMFFGVKIDLFGQ